MDVLAIIDRERSRQHHSLNLIASENAVSQNILRALGSELTNKYAEGYPGKRWYSGCAFTDEIEAYAVEKAKSLFGAEHANVQPHSGTSANIAAYLALIQPGDRVLAFDLSHGGHLSHGAPFNISGKVYRFVHYGVRRDDYLLDVDAVHAAFERHPDIKLMLAGASSYPRRIDFAMLAGIARQHGALFLADIAHISGLVATGHHPSPVAVSDVVSMSTHKTIRGPRGGMLLCSKAYAAKIDRAVFPGSQGGPLEHVVAAKAIMLEEASRPEFKAYIAEVLASMQELVRCLSHLNAKRFVALTGGTDNHLALFDLGKEGKLTGLQAEERLAANNIFVNRNMIPFDPLPPATTSGIRIGTAMLVTQGATRKDMPRLAELIAAALDGTDVRHEVAAMCDELCLRH